MDVPDYLKAIFLEVIPAIPVLVPVTAAISLIYFSGHQAVPDHRVEQWLLESNIVPPGHDFNRWSWKCRTHD